MDNAEEVVCSVDPFCYVSHLSAMEYHGLTNRMPTLLFISSPRPRYGERRRGSGWSGIWEHRYEHPFVISQGRIRVTSEKEGCVTYQAPHTGITQPGTRRALYAETDVIWTTFHVTDETDMEKIGQAILVPHFNPLLSDNDPALELWRESIPKLQDSNH